MGLLPPEAGATIANTLWWARGQQSARRFARALRNPREAQWRWLAQALAANRDCEYGQRYDFGSIRTANDFARRVPMVTHDTLTGDIARIQQGERAVLTTAPVTHLAPTSGSTGPRKLVPFTVSLQHGFSDAVNVWWTDLVRQRPSLLGGPGYWSVSPLEAPEPPVQAGHVRVGFADDADYLGGTMAWLVRQALAVPSSVRHAPHMDAFWGLTLTALLRRRGLRMLSVWHPSFIELLREQAERLWAPLLDAIATGRPAEWEYALPSQAQLGWSVTPNPARAAELRRVGVHRFDQWWPQLAVVSAWGDQAATSGFTQLQKSLEHTAPGVLVQPKGLLATEGVITVPYAGTYPVAATSHWFEFLDDASDVRALHELVRGEHYEVVLTNGGGLWRYRLGDMVECTGTLAATPTLRFLGRAGRNSDLRGEKLSEVFVAEVLRSLWQGGAMPYAVLAAYDSGEGVGYELRTTAGAVDSLAERCERALCANPHYALARRLGQLQPVRVVSVPHGEGVRALAAHRGRLGDAKPSVLAGIA